MRAKSLDDRQVGNLCSRAAEAENSLEKQFRPRGNLESEKRQALNHFQILDLFF